MGSLRRLAPPVPAAWLLCCLAALSGCGKVGDPLPPAIPRPRTISDLRVEHRGQSARLVFALPGQDVQLVEIYRMCPPLVVEERSDLIARLGQDELVEFPEASRFVFEDRDSKAAARCRYALRFVDRHGFPSEFSNFAPDSEGDRP